MERPLRHFTLLCCRFQRLTRVWQITFHLILYRHATDFSASVFNNVLVEFSSDCSFDNNVGPDAENRLLYRVRFRSQVPPIMPSGIEKQEYLNVTVPSENMQAERVGLHSEISQADMIQSDDPLLRSSSSTRVRNGQRVRSASRPRQRTRRSVRRYARGALDSELFNESVAADIPPGFYGKCVRFTFDYQEHLALSEVAFEAQTLVAADEAVALARLRALRPTPAPPAATLPPTTASTTRPTTPTPVQLPVTPGPVQPNVLELKTTPLVRPHSFSTPRAPFAPVPVAPVDGDRAGVSTPASITDTEAMGDEPYEDEEVPTTKQVPIVESARMFFARFLPLVIGISSVLLLAFVIIGILLLCCCCFKRCHQRHAERSAHRKRSCCHCCCFSPGLFPLKQAPPGDGSETVALHRMHSASGEPSSHASSHRRSHRPDGDGDERFIGMLGSLLVSVMAGIALVSGSSRSHLCQFSQGSRSRWIYVFLMPVFCAGRCILSEWCSEERKCIAAQRLDCALCAPAVPAGNEELADHV